MEDRYGDNGVIDGSVGIEFYMPSNSPRKGGFHNRDLIIGTKVAFHLGSIIRVEQVTLQCRNIRNPNVSMLASGRIIASTSMSLDHQSITDIGNTEYLQEACAATKLIDLSNNKLDNWIQVTNLLDTVTRVECINLSNNRIFGAPKKWPKTVWNNLTTLILNGVDLTSFSVVEQLLLRLPNLKSLDIAVNRLQFAHFSPEFTHNELEQLNLSKNVINSWKHVCKIGSRFPNLKRLLMCDNPLAIIGPRWNWQPEDHFPQLQTIMLTGCYLQSWSLVEQLGDFHNLKSVYLSRTPLTEFLPSNIRREIVAALLNKCMMLNGSEISKDDLTESRNVLIQYFSTISPKPNRYYELTREIGTGVGFNLSTRSHIRLTIRLRNGRFTTAIDDRIKAGDFAKAMGNILNEPSGCIQLRLLRQRASGKLLSKADAILSLHELDVKSGDCIVITTRKCRIQ